MITYIYDINGFFISEVFLQESPLEKGVYFEKPNSTSSIPPKTSKNEIAYWNGNNWEIKPNYSGKIYYSKIDKSEKTFEIGDDFDNNYTELSPLDLEYNINDEEIYFDNNKNQWEKFNKIFYNKKTSKTIKINFKDINEEFYANNTRIAPLHGEIFQKWDEDSNNWIIDEVAKSDFELQVRRSQIENLLLQSDYIELPSFLERKGQDSYNLWMTYRENLRSAYHDSELPLPEKPQ